MGICNSVTTDQTNGSHVLFELIYGEDQESSLVGSPHGVVSSNLQIQLTIDETVNKLRKASKCYIDPTMPHYDMTLQSFITSREQIDCQFNKLHAVVSQSSDKPLRVFPVDEVSPTSILMRNEIKQSFGALLCIFARYPALIKRAILTNWNHYGLYALRVLVDREVKFIFVDDYMLCNSKSSLFTAPFATEENGLQIWHFLLQKALFKLQFLTQQSIRKLPFINILQIFCDEIVTEYSVGTLSDSRSIWVDLINRYPCVLISKEHSQDVPMIGLSGGKEYFVMRAFFINGVRYYYLRNPCGAFQFRGNHFDPSNELQNAVNETLGEAFNPESGNFFINEKELREQFDRIYIVHFESNSKTTRSKIGIKNKETLFLEFNLKRAVLVQLCYDQFAYNHIPFGQTSNVSPNFYCPITYHVFSASGTFLGGMDNHFGCIGAKSVNLLDSVAPLEKGQYIIRIKKKENNYYYKDTNSFICANSPDQIVFNPKNIQQNTIAFNKKLLDRGRQKLKLEKGVGLSPVYTCVSWVGDIVIVYVQARIPASKALSLDVNFPDIENLECLSHANIKKDQHCLLMEVLSDELVIVFEKIDLKAKTQLGRYSVEAF